MLYRVCGLLLKSELLFPELPRDTGREVEFTFQLLPASIDVNSAVRWFHEWQLADDSCWLLFGRTQQGYLLRFPDLADFCVSSDGRTIACQPLPNTPVETIRHLLLDQVLPLAASRRGKIVIHASAVSAPKGAISFIGLSGYGKSTMAASLAQRGFPLMTDDCLVLDICQGELYGTPSYPSVRLWEDSLATLFEATQSSVSTAHYTSKRRVLFADGGLNFCDDRKPILQIYFLAPFQNAGHDDTIAITSIPPREALVELVKYSFKLDIADQPMLRNEFALLSQFVQLPLFYRLSYPHEFARLPEVQEAILAHLEQH